MSAPVLFSFETYQSESNAFSPLVGAGALTVEFTALLSSQGIGAQR
jgi:hypothetical protein